MFAVTIVISSDAHAEASSVDYVHILTKANTTHLCDSQFTYGIYCCLEMLVNNIKFLLTFSKPRCCLLTPLPLLFLPSVRWRGELKAQKIMD